MSEPLMVLPESALKMAAARKRGHAARPGSGPKGETCGSCTHRASVLGGARKFSKCELCKSNWTCGPGSDVNRKDAACASWQAISAKGKQ